MIARLRFLLVVLPLGTLLASPLAAQTIDWTRQLGTSSDDGSLGVSADGLGNVFLSGETRGDLGGTNAGNYWDAFVSKYDTSGNLLWTQQLGTSSDDVSLGVSADGLGNVFISGWTYGDLGETNAGSRDAFVSKYDASGNLLWIQQLGTSRDDFSWGVSADGRGSVFLSGDTRDDLDGTNAGGRDAFVVKLTDETFPPFLEGDFNFDYVVDAADYTVWRDNGGGASDYNLWVQNYGTVASTSTTVPEPATCGMLLSVLFSFAAGRNRPVRS